MIETNDGLPFIGENADGQFIATGFCGNGMTFGTVSAMMARDWATGRKIRGAIFFAANRKIFVLACGIICKENKDYPYYLIKGRLARAEADSVRELKKDRGMIVKSKKGKLAAYRDSKGDVNKRSAICPHMGCIVRWNHGGENMGLSVSRITFQTDRRSHCGTGGIGCWRRRNESDASTDLRLLERHPRAVNDETPVRLGPRDSVALS